MEANVTRFSNLYLFIIWNKALFARNKIIEDLASFCDIEMNVLIKWDEDKFDRNIKAFYGHKVDNIKEKKHFIGTGKFNVLLVRDKNPVFEKRKTRDGMTLVNSNIYDKKELYRSWTAYDFRVHCSLTEDETKHDLVVLFGNNIELYKYLKEASINTKGIEGFNSLNDLFSCGLLYGFEKLDIADKYVDIKCENKEDCIAFLCCQKDDDEKYYIKIDEKKIMINIEANQNSQNKEPKNTGFLQMTKKDLRYFIVKIKFK